jgi:tripartite-type tricarboxylate transporter receptor subunit TctC
MTPSPPEALAQHLSAELQRWNEIVKSAGIRLE